MKKQIIACVALCALTYAHAGEVEIPHQFAAGTKAVAAEVNANFTSAKTAVDDNAQRVVALESTTASHAQSIAAMQAALPGAGVRVSIDGVVVGRLVDAFTGRLRVDTGGGQEQVARAGNIGSALTLRVVSPTGYHFAIETSGFGSTRLQEGDLDYGLLYFDGADCSGSLYYPVEGDTGYFSTYTPGSNDSFPIKQWYARQGIVHASPDPADPNIAYMVRRGSAVQVVALASVQTYSNIAEDAVCVNLADVPDFNPADPLDVNNTVMPVEVWDPEVTGVSGPLGGEITVGL